MAFSLLLGLLATGALAEGLDRSAPAITEEFVSELNAIPKLWEAHVSPRFVGATVGDLADLCGTIRPGDAAYNNPLEEKEDDESNAYVAAEWDVRTAFPDCADVSGHVRDQSTCGSCWAFASTESFNDRRCIATGDHTPLSTRDTTSNCGFFACYSQGCNGGQPTQAWQWFTKVGVVTGGDYADLHKGKYCANYPFEPCAHHVPPGKYKKCPSSDGPTPKTPGCEKEYKGSYKADKKKASHAYTLRGIQKIQSDMTQYGSAAAAFTVYEDFPTYKSGIYHHVTGKALGGHAIKMIGWGTLNGQAYWLIMNSWNDTWGDKGTFKIKRGNDECGIENDVSAGQVSKTAIV